MSDGQFTSDGEQLDRSYLPYYPSSDDNQFSYRREGVCVCVCVVYEWVFIMEKCVCMCVCVFCVGAIVTLYVLFKYHIMEAASDQSMNPGSGYRVPLAAQGSYQPQSDQVRHHSPPSLSLSLCPFLYFINL